MTIWGLQTVSETISRIDRALKMIEQGTYGICAACHESIGAKRLTAKPFAIYCAHCQAHENRQQQMELKKNL